MDYLWFPNIVSDMSGHLVSRKSKKEDLIFSFLKTAFNELSSHSPLAPAITGTPSSLSMEAHHFFYFFYFFFFKVGI